MRIYLSLIFISLFFLNFIGCGKKEKIINTESEAIPVEVTEMKVSSIARYINLVGSLAPYKEANLAAQTTARIRKIYVDEGSTVSQGSLLFEMDDTQLEQAKIQYEIAKDNYERLKPLYESGSISKSQFEQIKANYETTEKTVKLLAENTQFKAPFSGVITSKRYNEGEIFLLSPTALGSPAIVSLVQLNPLKLILSINESNIKDIKLNQKAEIITDVFGKELFGGTVSRISPTVNPQTRTFDVEVKVPNNNLKLKPGMFVRTKIFLGEAEGILISRSNVIRQLGTAAYFGFVQKDSLAIRRDVKIGQEYDNMFEIVAGLEPGDRLITKGQGLLKDGSKIVVKTKN